MFVLQLSLTLSPFDILGFRRVTANTHTVPVILAGADLAGYATRNYLGRR